MVADGKIVACRGPRFKVALNRANPYSGQFIELWRVSDGKRQATIRSEMTKGVRFSPDGRTIIAVGDYPSLTTGNATDGDGVRLYDVATGAKIWN
jgi:hypothetical protein